MHQNKPFGDKSQILLALFVVADEETDVHKQLIA